MHKCGRNNEPTSLYILNKGVIAFAFLRLPQNTRMAHTVGATRAIISIKQSSAVDESLQVQFIFYQWYNHYISFKIISTKLSYYLVLFLCLSSTSLIITSMCTNSACQVTNVLF